MRSTLFLRSLALAATLLLAPQACVTMGQNDPEGGEVAPTSDSATLSVRNDNFADVDVYLMRSGHPYRLGRVDAGRTQEFALRPAILGVGSISFVARTVDGRGAATSGTISVSGGQTVEFRVAAVLSQSIATVR